MTRDEVIAWLMSRGFVRNKTIFTHPEWHGFRYVLRDTIMRKEYEHDSLAGFWSPLKFGSYKDLSINPVNMKLRGLRDWVVK